MKIVSANRIAPDGKSRLPMSHKKVARLIWVNNALQDVDVFPYALGTSNVTSRDGGGTWRSSSGCSGTSSSVGQYHLTTCMDFPVSHLWGWWMFFLVSFPSYSFFIPRWFYAVVVLFIYLMLFVYILMIISIFVNEM